MFRFTYLLLALVATCYGASIPESRIVGGTRATANQIPWQVSLRRNNNHFCGGCIVNQRWVLTAAHCLTGSAAGSTVVTATLRLNSGGDVYRASRFVLHPQYNSWSLRHDIALVQTASNIVYRPNVQPSRLPTSHFGTTGAAAVVSGWGRTSYPGVGSNDLLFLNTRVTSQADCRASSWRVTDDHICTLTRAGQGACHGDSGGPLTSGGVLIGLVSFGTSCARGIPDAFVRVFPYIRWIRGFTG